MIAYFINLSAPGEAREVSINPDALIDDVRRLLQASNVDYHVIAPGAADQVWHEHGAENPRRLVLGCDQYGEWRDPLCSLAEAVEMVSGG